MCEFCTKHGEGGKWYLLMENYSNELLNQRHRKEFFINLMNYKYRPGVIFREDYMPLDSPLVRWYEFMRPPLKLLTKAPRFVRDFLSWGQKRSHFGQIVTLEDSESILNNVDGVVRIPCTCRKFVAGKDNIRCCYVLSADKELHSMLDDYVSLDIISSEEAIKSFREHDLEGLVHSVWTFKTPYTGCLCNCNQECIPYRSHHIYPFMFKSEYVADADLNKCNGCYECVKRCIFGAIDKVLLDSKVKVDYYRCFGCGVCRSVCDKKAINMIDRNKTIVSDIWV